MKDIIKIDMAISEKDFFKTIADDAKWSWENQGGFTITVEKEGYYCWEVEIAKEEIAAVENHYRDFEGNSAICIILKSGLRIYCFVDDYSTLL